MLSSYGGGLFKMFWLDQEGFTHPRYKHEMTQALYLFISYSIGGQAYTKCGLCDYPVWHVMDFQNSHNLILRNNSSPQKSTPCENVVSEFLYPFVCPTHKQN